MDSEYVVDEWWSNDNASQEFWDAGDRQDDDGWSNDASWSTSLDFTDRDVLTLEMKTTYGFERLEVQISLDEVESVSSDSSTDTYTIDVDEYSGDESVTFYGKDDDVLIETVPRSSESGYKLRMRNSSYDDVYGEFIDPRFTD